MANKTEQGKGQGLCPHGNFPSSCEICSTEMESKETGEIVLKEQEAIFGKTTETGVKASLPTISYDIIDENGEVTTFKFLYSPKTPEKWSLHTTNEDLKLKDLDSPLDPGRVREALYDFQSNRDLSRRGVEIGDIVGERRSDLAFLFALSIGSEFAMNSLEVSEPKFRDVKEEVSSTITAGYGDERWATTGRSSRIVDVRHQYVSINRKLLPNLADKYNIGYEIPLTAGEEEAKEEVNKAIQTYFFSRFNKALRDSLKYWAPDELDKDADNREDILDTHDTLTKWFDVLMESGAITRGVDNEYEKIPTGKWRDEVLQELKMEFPDQEKREVDVVQASQLLETLSDLVTPLNVLDPDLGSRISDEFRQIKSEWTTLKLNPKKVLNMVQVLEQDARERIKEVEINANLSKVLKIASPEDEEKEQNNNKFAISEISSRISSILNRYLTMSQFGTLSSDDLQHMIERRNAALEEANRQDGDVQLAHLGMQALENELRKADNERYELLARIHPDWQTPEAKVFITLFELKGNELGRLIVDRGKVSNLWDGDVKEIGSYRVEDDGLTTRLTRYTRSGKPDSPSFELRNGEYVLFKKGYVDEKRHSKLWNVEFDHDSTIPLRVIGSVDPYGSEEAPVETPPSTKTSNRELTPLVAPRQPTFQRYGKPEQEASREIIEPDQVIKYTGSLNHMLGVLEFTSYVGSGRGAEVVKLKQAIEKRLDILPNTGKKKIQKEMSKFDTALKKVIQKQESGQDWLNDWEGRAGLVFGKILPQLKEENHDLKEIYENIQEFIEETIADPKIPIEELEATIRGLYT